MFTKNFKEDLKAIFNRVDSGGKGFAFNRFADGEYHVLEGKPLQGWDWSMKPEFSVTSSLLGNALSYEDDNYYYGVSCSCCDKEKYEYYKNKLSKVWHKVSYSNMFANGNYLDTLKWLSFKRDIVLIANEKTNINNLPFHVSRFQPVKSNALEDFDKNPEAELSKYRWLLNYNSKNLVLISAGPLAKIILYRMFCIHPDNYYLDIGSVIDPFIHGNTRIYHHHPSWRSMICTGL